MTRPLSDFTDMARQQLSLELAGAHQEQNASLAVALAASWEASERGGSLPRRASRNAASLSNGTSALSNGHSAVHAAVHKSAADATEADSALEHSAAVHAGCLPAPYISGLRNVSWPGRNQVRLCRRCKPPACSVVSPISKVVIAFITLSVNYGAS